MFGRVARFFRTIRRTRASVREIDPDEIFLDSSNLPSFDRHQFEGRMERPISRRTVLALGGVFLAVLIAFSLRGAALQIGDGERYAAQSRENRLRHTLIFGERGVFTDRRGEKLAWNAADDPASAFARRHYSARAGLSSALGYLKYPRTDSAGFYYQVDFEGMDGAEKFLSEYVAPEHGLKIVEVDALGAVQSESVLREPKSGAEVSLSIDARLTERLYRSIASLAREKGFTGGAGVMMDVENGEILALASFPEYDSQILSDGADSAAIEAFVSDERKPFLNRATVGLYPPGSVAKPFIAAAALAEGVITPEETITSTGALLVPNPYDPEKPTVFKDWKAHGVVNMRRALAVSSDVYFYVIGGGVPPGAAESGSAGRRGLGIDALERYLRLFGFGAAPGGNDFFGAAGVIPNPEWKKQNFGGEPWRLGNTYHTAIGQYGLQVTPLQVVRAIAAIANGGKLVTPRLTREDEPPLFQALPIAPPHLAVVREGLRLAVTSGTAAGLNLAGVSVAAKTGTAELGVSKRFVTSWITGFFPYERPRYGFVVVMERGPRENTVGALFVIREVLDWMSVSTPEYLTSEL